MADIPKTRQGIGTEDTIESVKAPEGGAGRGGAEELPIVEPACYQVGPELARGGMGRILEAEDQRLKRPVAIKELLAPDLDRARRFTREALITARLEHP